MRAPKLILVAIKSPEARGQATLRKAAQLAQATGARLELFHAITTPLFIDALALEGLTIPEAQKRWKRDTIAALEKHARPLRNLGLEVETSCDWDFPAYEAVVRRAARSDASLIVAERHATRHVLPWLLRFNDWELLRRSPVPVLLVKHARAWKRPVVLAAIDPSHMFSKPSGLDRQILEAGHTLAKALGGNLHAMHAVPKDILPAETRSARKSFAGELAHLDISPARRHLVAGHAIDVVPRVAKQLHAAIAVMGAVSRSGISRLVIGNIAEQVLDSLPCDVLLLKPASFKSRVKGKLRGVRLMANPAFA
jgi:universal stress protein E